MTSDMTYRRVSFNRLLTENALSVALRFTFNIHCALHACVCVDRAEAFTPVTASTRTSHQTRNDEEISGIEMKDARDRQTPGTEVARRRQRVAMAISHAAEVHACGRR